MNHLNASYEQYVCVSLRQRVRALDAAVVDSKHVCDHARGVAILVFYTMECIDSKQANSDC